MTLRLPSFVPEGLLLFCVLFAPLAFGAVEAWSLAIFQIAAFLLASCCILRGRPSVRGSAAGLWPVAVGFCALSLIQLGVVRRPGMPSALLPSTGSARSALSAALLWASYSSLLWCAPQILDERPAQKRLAWTVFGAGCFVALVGLIQLGQGNTAYYGLRTVHNRDPFGPFVNRDNAASFMAMGASVGTGLLVGWLSDTGSERTAGEALERIVLAALHLFFIGLLLLGIVKAGSRGALLAMAAAAGVILALSLRFISSARRRRAAAAALALVAATAVAVVLSHPRLVGNVFSSPDYSTAVRLSIYRSSWRIIRDFPLWGIGAGCIKTVFPPYQNRALYTSYIDHLHSEGFEFWVQFGWIGLAALVAALSLYFRSTLSRWLRLASPPRRALAGGVLGAVLAFLLHGLVDFNFEIPGLACVFLSLTSLLSSILAPRDERAGPAPVHKAAALAPLVLAALAARPAVGDALAYRAGGLSGPARARLLEKAVAWDPSPEMHSKLAVELREEADHDAAARDELAGRSALQAAAALDTDPYDPDYRRQFGSALSALGRRDDAAPYLNVRPSLGERTR